MAVAITVTAAETVLVGSSTPSVTISLKHSTDRNAAGNEILNAATAVTNTTTGQALTVTGDPTIPANSFIWFETTAKSGVVRSVHVTMTHTED